MVVTSILTGIILLFNPFHDRSIPFITDSQMMTEESLGKERVWPSRGLVQRHPSASLVRDDVMGDGVQKLYA